MSKQKNNEQELSCEERYLRRLAAAERFYLQLVVAVLAACAIAIAIAVITDVLLGVALAVFSAAVYIFFSTDELYKQLGVRYSDLCGRIHITRAVAKYGDTVVIPSRLIWVDVTKISDGAFASEKNSELARIYLPRSIEYIGKDIFGNIPTPQVLYEGSREEWNSIEGADAIDISCVSFDVVQPRLESKPKKSKCRKGGEAEK